ncbi:tRNA (guanine-N(7)-)-methyltransferase non-catalytic subunit trm82 [Metarhizium acridum]|uniref:tRNA (guanine-N(7)-)-methyltransferase non-catalytic subunit trm82 n=1 Tax=Metarhizium acridum TaxID=92637 RepID=UPI001C6B5E6B|nr:tRNA (guanine-N(7)-)-methyltransferase non-catalytic subunit trm82 [Metarhizium acridum]
MSLTAIPYNRVQTIGNILFATRGGKIHSFNLSDHNHISTWQHPDIEKHIRESDSKTEPKDETKTPTDAENVPETEESEPPAKRQKVAEGDLNFPVGDATATKEENVQKKGKGGKGKGKGDNHGDKSRMGRVVDRPLITLMTCTDDGKHLIAVSGHDKSVWVFEHDGEGQLTQLSQRVMPKRPSAITTGPGSQIIVADKFGDVYALPLIMTPLSPSSLALRTAPTPKPSLTEPAANTFTVHSKRNLEALEHQRKQIELERSKGAEAKPEGPVFESHLLLGHVSMLTSLIVTETQGRKYILTADRDEHIRVSRYIPQAHIIEGFCLGHKEFISEMTIPLRREDVLVSGGGDEELFIWDWKAGRVLSKTNLLALAREIAPQTTRIAVSGLTSLVYPEEGGVTYVLAICEDIPAIFTWQLTPENELKNPGIIQLPCNPLHIAIASASNETALKLVVAMDPGPNVQAKSLHAYTLTRTEHRLSSDVEIPIHGQRSDGPEMQVSESEIRNMFYAVENLRKQGGGGEDAGTTEGNGEVEASPAEA